MVAAAGERVAAAGEAGGESIICRSPLTWVFLIWLHIPPVIVNLPWIFVPLLEKLPPGCTVTLPLTVPPSINVQFCPADTTILPVKVPLYTPLQVVPEAGTGTTSGLMKTPSATGSMPTVTW